MGVPPRVGAHKRTAQQLTGRLRLLPKTASEETPYGMTWPKAPSGSHSLPSLLGSVPDPSARQLLELPLLVGSVVRRH